ncbi:hypothetical protein LPW26_07870 [Rhodopseudomonas sp. HC1]|uniref:hypothetical protein n=1 Tax=Rhodopseudomonas infernalis TaxID=2897386 RepID=UPI001EE8F935|nr:hypothetical protein [Rhodopseudomonas infernalis]MCG6204548.1 hypothetical protein [Rhodopseudomonas infernalis]
MDQDDIKAILDRVLTWPPERQKDAAQLLLVMEEADANPYHLTEAQAAEVRRRIAMKGGAVLTLDEARRHFEQLFREGSGGETEER